MAEKVWDRCPKCLSKLTNKVECRTCGIIFDKYFQAEARKKEQVEQEAAKKTKSGRRSIMIMAGLILVPAFAAAFYFLGRTSSPPVGNMAVTAPVVKEDRGVEPPVLQKSPVTEVDVRGKGGGDSTDKRFIQSARDATVSVKTPWGLGSGFFISENSIVTNKHVVQFNNEKFEEFRQKIVQRRQVLDRDVEKTNEIKRRMAAMPDGPDRRQLAVVVQMREAELNKIIPIQQEAEKKLKEMEEKKSSKDVIIVMANGVEHSVSNVIISNIHDLALLKVYTASAPVLKRNRDGRHLEQGDTVYTVGSPMGLANTVTSGVFSGYRKMVDKNEVYLQTDAPINPGNSGGPLIDGHGHVYGVNTMVMSNTEGIGFAIPIDTVFEEFRNSI